MYGGFENYNRKRNEDKILYGEASKKTKEFLQSTKDMRLQIEKQLERLEDGDNKNMQAMTYCLEERIKQCDETLANLLTVKNRILNKPVLKRETIEAMNIELPFPKEIYQIDSHNNRELRDVINYTPFRSEPSTSNEFSEYSNFRGSAYRENNDILHEITHYNPLAAVADVGNLPFSRYSTIRSQEYETDESDTYPRVTGFTKYPTNQSSSNDQSAKSPEGIVKFCTNIRDFQYILEQNGKEREEHMNRVKKFFQEIPSVPHEQHLPAGGIERPQTQPQAYHQPIYKPLHQAGYQPTFEPQYHSENQPQLQAQFQPQTRSYQMYSQPSNWGYTLSNTDAKKPQLVQPICCGPTKLRPIFDSKIQKLEQQIVKFCFEIKEKNILIEQCCRAKEVLLCQKQNLHAILLRLCEKIKQLETKLYRIKMTVCCSNFPVQECTTSISCTEEIQNLQKLEDQLETLYNGAKHKECLLEICRRSVKVLEQDKLEWQQSIRDMEKIRSELQKQLGDMKKKVCRPNSSPGIQTRPMSVDTIPEKDSTVPDSDGSSNLHEYLSLDVNKKQPKTSEQPRSSMPVTPRTSIASKSRIQPEIGRSSTHTTHRCLKDCRCRRR